MNRSRIARSLLSALSALTLAVLTPGCAGRVIEVGENDGGAAAPPVPASSPAAALPDGVVAIVEGRARSIASDGTQIYLGDDSGNVVSVPKAGGAVVTLVDGSVVGGGTPIESLAVDGDKLYFSSLWGGQLARIPKLGGAVEVVADHLLTPHQMALDATHLYFIVDDNASPPGPAVLRVAKTGGPVENVAVAQPDVTALVLSDTDVYFAAGWDQPDGSIRRVAKAGGAVEVVASSIDTREGAPLGGQTVANLALLGAQVAFVEPHSGRLTYAPIAGGQPIRTGMTSIFSSGLATDPRSALVAVAMNDDGLTGALVRLDGSGAVERTLATWPRTATASSGFAPVDAIVIDADRVYWVDVDVNDAKAEAVSTIRQAVLP